MQAKYKIIFISEQRNISSQANYNMKSVFSVVTVSSWSCHDFRFTWLAVLQTVGGLYRKWTWRKGNQKLWSPAVFKTLSQEGCVPLNRYWNDKQQRWWVICEWSCELVCFGCSLFCSRYRFYFLLWLYIQRQVGAGIAQSVVCWTCCPAWCSIAGSTLWVTSRSDFSLRVNMGSDSIP